VQTAELLHELPDIHLVTVNIKDLRNVGIGISENLGNSLEKVYVAVHEILGKLDD
jgi:Ni,Fe-hydrogenase maturation factor